MRCAATLGVVCLALVCSSIASAQQSRFQVCGQFDWDGKRGFYVNFENTAVNGTCRLANLGLYAGVADGSAWRFMGAAVTVAAGQTLLVEARLGNGANTLKLNGLTVGTANGAFTPNGGLAESAFQPEWARAAADYELIPVDLSVRVNGLQVVSGPVPQPTSAAVRRFESMLPYRFNLPLNGASTIDITARVRVETWRSTRALAPFIDAYGQSIHARYPGKVVEDADLRRAWAAENVRLNAWPSRTDTDAYGGQRNAGWSLPPTGYYRTNKRNGVWWLITPLGNPVFYTGLCTAPALAWDQTPVTEREWLWKRLPSRTGAFAPIWGTNPWGSDPGVSYLAQHSVNLIRRHGSNWQTRARASLVRRLDAWGFSGVGKWSEAIPGVPDIPVLGRWGVPVLVRHPDVFDPAVKATFRQVIADQVLPRKNDPYLVGWSLGNEFDEIVTRAQIREVGQNHRQSAAYLAMFDEAVRTIYAGDRSRATTAWAGGIPEGDLEAMRRFFAATYYRFVYETVKELDPNHLYFGFWIVPYWWENDADWDLSAAYCDVVGYDRYAPEFAGIEWLIDRFDKPILLGEFSFPAWYGGHRGFGRYFNNVETDRDSGVAYARLLNDAARHPKCIGTLWFQYRDQPLTGRGPGNPPELVSGEHYAFGFVDLQDRPKWDLVNRARTANLAVNATRLAVTPP